MKKSRKESPFRDKNDRPIFEGDLCRSEIIGGLKSEKKELLYERVAYLRGDWVLMEVDFDYESHEDKPVLLKDYCANIEVIEEP